MSDKQLPMILDKRKFSEKRPIVHGIYELGKIGLAGAITALLSMNR